MSWYYTNSFDLADPQGSTDQLQELLFFKNKNLGLEILINYLIAAFIALYLSIELLALWGLESYWRQ